MQILGVWIVIGMSFCLRKNETKKKQKQEQQQKYTHTHEKKKCEKQHNTGNPGKYHGFQRVVVVVLVVVVAVVVVFVAVMVIVLPCSLLFCTITGGFSQQDQILSAKIAKSIGVCVYRRSY